MSAKDIYHDVVKQALKDEGWEITADPLRIQFLGVELRIDLGAERVIAADRNGEKIAVEIKSFLRSSAITDFHEALGQYIDYREGLTHIEPDRLYVSRSSDHRLSDLLPITLWAVYDPAVSTQIDCLSSRK